MADVTACDVALIDMARRIARDESRPRKMRLAAWLVAGVFRVRVRLGLSRRGRSKLTFAFWGRWCGPGYGGGEPTDALDCACKSHDECYSAAGTPGRLLRLRWAGRDR